jgi:hypothetical protein
MPIGNNLAKLFFEKTIEKKLKKTTLLRGVCLVHRVSSTPKKGST